MTEAELKKEEAVAGAGSGAGAGAGKASSTDVDVLIEDGRTRSRSRSRSRSRTASIFTVRRPDLPWYSACSHMVVQVAPEADPDVDTSVMRIFRLTKPQWGWVVISFLAAMVNGSIFPLFSIAFSEMITIFFEPEIDVMRDDGVFWGVGFVILGVLAGTLATARHVIPPWRSRASGCLLTGLNDAQASRTSACLAVSASWVRTWHAGCGPWRSVPCYTRTWHSTIRTRTQLACWRHSLQRMRRL